MKRKTIRCFIGLGLFLICFFTVMPCQADLADRVAGDLRPMNAKIALLRGEEIILNKGDVAGVHAGDLFTVFKIGPALRDPDTGEDLGTLTDPVALIQVKRLRSRHCICTIVLQVEKLSEGMPAVRFKDIPSLMVLEDQSKAAHRLQNRLKLKLADLDWIPGRPEDVRLLKSWDEAFLRQRGAGMVFVLSKDALTLFNRLGRPVRSWLREMGGAESKISAPVRTGRAVSVPHSSPSFSGSATGEFQAVLRVDALLIGMEVRDLDGNGSPDILFLTPDGLRFRPDMDPQREIFYRYRGMGELVNFSVGASGLIALNVYEAGHRMSSLLLRININRFEVVAEDINYILGFFDMGSGRKDSLLGQQFDSEQVFGSRIIRFKMGSKVFSSSETVHVPRDFRITGAAFFGPGQKPDVAFINDHHKLVIRRAGRKIWMSARNVGGSVRYVTVHEGTDKLGFSRAIHIETPPMVLNAGPGRDVELLVVANRGVSGNVIDGFSSFQSGEILHVSTSSLGRTLKPVTAPLEGAIQGMSIFNEKLYCGLVKGSMLSDQYESYIVVFPFSGGNKE